MATVTERWFGHEKLDVYQGALAFIGWFSPILEGTKRESDVKDHLGRAADSVVLNIAAGNGKFSPRDRCRFFDTAHGSALECAAGLDILVVQGRLMIEQIRAGTERLQRVVRMLMGLIKRHSDRGYEKQPPVLEV